MMNPMTSSATASGPITALMLPRSTPTISVPRIFLRCAACNGRYRNRCDVGSVMTRQLWLPDCAGTVSSRPLYALAQTGLVGTDRRR